MKRIALGFLLIVLLIASSVGAQDDVNSAPLDSFAFTYSLHLAVEGLDTFAISADLGGSGAVDRSAHAFAASLKGTTALGTMPAVPVNEELRWVDDTLYIKAGENWQARAGASAYVADWITHYGFVDADAAALADWDLSGVDSLDAIIAVLTSADPAAFLTTQRLDDDMVGEVRTAHYQTTADLHALMQTDAFVEAVVTLASAQGTMLVVFDRAKVAEIVRANSAMFAGATVTLDQYVDENEHLLYRATLSANIPVDPGQGGYLNAPFTGTFTLDITLSNQNQPQNISAPNGAQPVNEWTFAAPPTPEPAGDGRTQYIFFSQTGENTPAEQPFEAQAGDRVTITVSGQDLDFDSTLTLLSPGGEALAENEDHETPSFLLGDYQSQIADFLIPESGTYTAQVSEYDGAAGNFALSITIQR